MGWTRKEIHAALVKAGVVCSVSRVKKCPLGGELRWRSNHIQPTPAPEAMHSSVDVTQGLLGSGTRYLRLPPSLLPTFQRVAGEEVVVARCPSTRAPMEGRVVRKTHEAV